MVWRSLKRLKPIQQGRIGMYLRYVPTEEHAASGSREYFTSAIRTKIVYEGHKLVVAPISMPTNPYPLLTLELAPRSTVRTNNVRDLVARRDGLVCGPHLMGCRKPLDLQTATIDHIIPRAMCPAMGIPPELVGRPWNIQLMHKECNALKGNYWVGYPMFSCTCHAVLFSPDNKAVLYTNCSTVAGWVHWIIMEDAIQLNDRTWSLWAAQKIYDTRQVNASKLWHIGAELQVVLGFMYKRYTTQGSALYSVSRPAADYRNARVLSILCRDNPENMAVWDLMDWVTVLPGAINRSKGRNIRFRYNGDASDPIDINVKPDTTRRKTYQLVPREVEIEGMYFGEYGEWLVY